MSSEDKNNTTGLRRSSRSTRGSIKPIVDLTQTKVDSVSDDEDIEEIDQVVEISEEDSEDEEFSATKISKKNSKSTPRGKEAKSAQKLTTPGRRRQTIDSSSKDKISKRAPRTSGSSKVKPKTKAKAPDKADTPPESKAKNSTKTETINEDDEDVYYELNEKDMQEINKAFDMNSSDDVDEFLGCDDLKTAMRSLGFEPRVDDVKKLISKYGNKEGKVNRDGFHKIMASKMNSAPGFNDSVGNDEISKVFNLLDLDKAGRITLENLRAIAKELNEELDDDELLEMITEADLDGNNQIDKNEFYHIMKKTSLY